MKVLIYTDRPERSDAELERLTKLRAEGHDAQFRHAFGKAEKCDLVITARPDVEKVYKKAKIKTNK